MILFPWVINHLRVLADETAGWHVDRLLTTFADVLERRDVSSSYKERLEIVFQPLCPPMTWRPRWNIPDEQPVSRRQQRRRDFTKVQQFFKEDYLALLRRYLTERTSSVLRYAFADWVSSRPSVQVACGDVRRSASYQSIKVGTRVR